MKKPRILIAVPNLGNIRTELSIMFLRWATHPDFEVKIWTPENLIPLDNARNVIIKEFLSSDFDFLMFVDADIVPPVDVLDLVKLNLDVVAPVSYVFKEEGIVPMALSRVSEGWTITEDLKRGELAEKDCVGAGCLIIARRVLEKVPTCRFRYKADGTTEADEGFDWNEKVKKAGFRIFIHGGYETSHYKTVDLKRLVPMQNNLRMLQEKVIEKDRLLHCTGGDDTFWIDAKVDLIMLTYNGITPVKKAVQSIQEMNSQKSEKFRFFAIDDCSFDGTAEWLKKHGIETFENKINLGVAATRNSGIDLASSDADFIGFCDQDIEIMTRDWLQLLLSGFYSPRVGAVAPCSDFVSGLQRKSVISTNVFQPCPYLIPLLIFFRREVIEKVGRFDGFGMKWGAEDIDYSIRVRKAGYDLINVRDVFVHHIGFQTKQRPLDEYKKHYKMLKQKWGKETFDELFQFEKWLNRNV